MRVIVWVKVGRLIYDIKVRKCPPNYITKESEYIIEVDDYTDDDIKEYFEKPQIWGRRHEDPEKEQYISLMHDEDEGVHEC